MRLTIEIDDSLGGTIEALALIRQLQGLQPESFPLPEAGPCDNPAATIAERSEALMQRCRIVGPVIRKKDAIAVIGCDPSSFYKLQRNKGEYVSESVRQRCNEALSLSADEFLQRLRALRSRQLPAR